MHTCVCSASIILTAPCLCAAHTEESGKGGSITRTKMSGTDEWKHWLEAQLARKSQEAPPSPNAAAATAPMMLSSAAQNLAPTNAALRANCDYSVGSKKHSIWLDRQLGVQKETAAPAPLQPPDLNRYDANLPATVNALYRGQDLSALSHKDWLDQQLQRRTLGHPNMHVNKPVRGECEPPQRQSNDGSLGSSAHSAWLQQQFLGRRL